MEVFMSENLLEIKNLTVEIGEKEILHNINLNLNAGETHVLMGPNGAGKTTLGLTIMGNPRYNVINGSIVLDGKDITEEAVNDPSSRALLSGRKAAAGESPSTPHGLFLNPSALQGKAYCRMSMSPCSRSRSYNRSLFCRLPTLLLSLCPRWACQSLLRSYSFSF